LSRPEPPVEDTAPPSVDDHAFEAPVGRPWERCVHCKLAESAHVTTTGGGYAEHLRRAYAAEPVPEVQPVDAAPSSHPRDHIGHEVVVCSEGGAITGLHCRDCDMAVDYIQIQEDV
jgi:hypothetical protein